MNRLSLQTLATGTGMAIEEGIADGDQENANSGSRGGRSGEQGHNSQDTHSHVNSECPHRLAERTRADVFTGCGEAQGQSSRDHTPHGKVGKRTGKIPHSSSER